MGRAKKKSAGRARRGLTGILLLTVAVLLAIAIGAHVEAHRSPPTPDGVPSRVEEIAGWFGRYIAAPLLRVTGLWLGLLVPFALAGLGTRLLLGRALAGTSARSLLLLAGAGLLASAFSTLATAPVTASRELFAGGVGPLVLAAFHALFGRTGAVVVLGGASLAYVLAIALSEARLVAWGRAGLSKLGLFAGERAADALRGLREDLEESRLKKSKREKPKVLGPSPGDDFDEEEDDDRDQAIEDEDENENDDEKEVGEDEEEEWIGDAAPAISIVTSAPVTAASRAAAPSPAPDVPLVVLPLRGEPPVRRAAEEPVSALDVLQELQIDPEIPYQIPPEDFLEGDGEDSSASPHEELLASAKILEKALRDFGVRGKVTQVQPGPVITRFEIEPAAGQKVAPIANLSDDLALALKARHIRIVAPIPGKAAVGIEVPNPRQAMVRLGPLLQSPAYKNDSSPLNIALGRTISGDPFCAALDRMPHLLVAGATGAGKSVCINTIITSIIYRAGPERVRFIMIDPKMLELMSYVGLPHLVPPVVTQPKEVAKILKWVVSEMETRYRTLARVGVRNIVDYNRRQEEEGAPALTYLVVIVDELADLMLSNLRSEIEESIARLAQMARAVGIHLVVATQRPSVDVITGVIKANFPSRIAFQVPSRIDSRTILDSMGAERLLGRGDMLYLGVGMAAPLRIHGSYVSTEETADVVEWLKTRHPRAETSLEATGAGNELDLYPRERDDELFDESSRILVAHQQGSVSLLQRRLKVGYARAARLVDMMEEAGIVGPFTGSKAREVLVPTVEELEKKLAAMKQAAFGAKPGR